MGLVALLITVLVMILGAGYLLFGTKSSPVSLENTSATVSGLGDGLSIYEETRGKALDTKRLLERKAEDTMRVGTGEEDTSPSVPQKRAPSIAITDRLVDFGHDTSTKKRSIDTIVLHSSYDPDGRDPYSVEAVIKIWKGYDVAPHYLIDRKGKIFRLVADVSVAYHAGASKMPDGRMNVNEFSLGIELLNTKTDRLTDAQYTALNSLIASIKESYPIKNVVGHSDIAPDRKDDPWNFDWKRLQ